MFHRYCRVLPATYSRAAGERWHPQPSAKRSPAWRTLRFDGIIKEANETAGEVADKAVRDAALINGAQAAEHYEIARYGSLIARAKRLGPQ